MQMTHTRLLVTSFKECFLFYRDILEFPVLWGDENGTYADFDVDGHILALFERAPMAAAIGATESERQDATQDSVCLVYTVENVEAAYRSLVDKGVQSLNEPHDRLDWGIRCFHFRDPAGNLIEVNRVLATATA